MERSRHSWKSRVIIYSILVLIGSLLTAQTVALSDVLLAPPTYSNQAQDSNDEYPESHFGSQDLQPEIGVGPNYVWKAVNDLDREEGVPSSGVESSGSGNRRPAGLEFTSDTGPIPVSASQPLPAQLPRNLPPSRLAQETAAQAASQNGLDPSNAAPGASADGQTQAQPTSQGTPGSSDSSPSTGVPGSAKDSDPVRSPQSTTGQFTSSQAIPGQSTTGLSAPRGGIQEVALIASDSGYYPNVILATRDIPVRIFITSASKKPLCIMLDTFQVRKQVRSQKIEEISFTPTQAGQYRFYCPVNGIQGTLLVKELGGPAVVSPDSSLRESAQNSTQSSTQSTAQSSTQSTAQPSMDGNSGSGG